MEVEQNRWNYQLITLIDRGFERLPGHRDLPVAELPLAELGGEPVGLPAQLAGRELDLGERGQPGLVGVSARIERGDLGPPALADARQLLGHRHARRAQ